MTNITTTDATTNLPSITPGEWYEFSFSGTFNGVSIQMTNTLGVPLTEAPITEVSRRAVFISEEELDFVVSGGSAPTIVATHSKIRYK
tara:strand:+ start:928 stop:1191 length:264 start_codon:yes stop_codon:yes gene_type:complete